MPLSPALRYYINKNILSENQIKSLLSAQKHTLASEPVRELLRKRIITIDDALRLSYQQRRNVATQTVSTLLADGVLAVSEVLALNEQQRQQLAQTPCSDLLRSRVMTLQNVLSLNTFQLKRLASKILRTYIIEGSLTLEEVMAFEQYRFDTFASEAIRDLLDKGFLCVATIKQLNADQAFVLHCAYDLIVKKALPIERSLQLSAEQGYILGACVVRDCILSGAIDLARALTFSVDQGYVLYSRAVNDLIKQGIITLDEALGYTREQGELLRSGAVHEYLLQKKFSLAELFAMSAQEHELLEMKALMALTQHNYLTWTQALALLPHQKQNLASPVVADFIRFGRLTLAEAKALTDIQRENLESEDILAFIFEGMLTFQDVLRLTYTQRCRLESDVIRQLIDEKALTVKQALALTSRQQMNLESRGIQTFLAQGVLSLSQVLELDLLNRRKLELEVVGDLIADKVLTLEQVFDFAYVECRHLEHLYHLVLQGVMQLGQLSRWVNTRRNLLRSSSAVNLLIEGRVTPQEMEMLTFDQVQLLAQDGVEERLRNGSLTIWDISAGILEEACIQESISQSASRLRKRYAHQLETIGVNTILSRLESDVDSAEESSIQGIGTAVNACLDRLLNPCYDYVDPHSGVTIKVLLALIDCMLHDASLVVDRPKLLEVFLDTLAKIELGNYSFELDEPYRPLCGAATFNILLLNLWHLHPDISVWLVDGSDTLFQATQIVQEEATRYLLTLANPQTVPGLFAILHLLEQIKEEGVKPIWGKIQASVIDRLYTLFFGNRYRLRDEYFSAELLSPCQTIHLKEDRVFKERIFSSQGYTVYSSNMLRSSLILGSADALAPAFNQAPSP